MDRNFLFVIVPAVTQTGLQAIQTALALLSYRQGKMTEMQSERRRHWIRGFLPYFVLLSLTWGAVAFDLYRRSGQVDSVGVNNIRFVSQSMDLIVDKIYRNEEVTIDGKSFDHCEFHNVKFIFNGTAPFHMEHVVLDGIWISTDSVSIETFGRLLYQLRFLAVPVSEKGNIFLHGEHQIPITRAPQNEDH